MSCVLRAGGAAFDAHAFLRGSGLAADVTFRRGEPKVPGHPDGPRRSISGFNVGVSESGIDDLAGQVRDAIAFLDRHEGDLRRLADCPDVEHVSLDFAIRRRGVAGQTDTFPAALLRRAGGLGIDLVVTHCEVLEE